LCRACGAVGRHAHRHGAVQKVRKALFRISHHCAWTLQGATGDWRGDDPETVSSWLMLTGASFSMMIIVTFYTAQVVSSLILSTNVVRSEYTSFEEAVRHRAPMCVLQGLVGSLEEHYPDVARYNLAVPVVYYADTLTGLDEGRCSIGIIDEAIWGVLGKRPEHCTSKAVLADVVTIRALSLPIRQNMHRPISWAMEKRFAARSWTLYVDEAKQELSRDNLYLPNGCIAPGSDERRRLQDDSRSIAQKLAQGQPLGGLRGELARQRKGSRRLAVKATVAALESGSGLASGVDETVVVPLTLAGAAGPLFICFLTSSIALLLNCLGRLVARSHRHRRRRARQEAERAAAAAKRSLTFRRAANGNAVQAGQVRIRRRPTGGSRRSSPQEDSPDGQGAGV